MDIEKFVNSKFYRGFEWFYRLLFLNVLLFLTSFLLASIPFYFLYINPDLEILALIGLVMVVISFFPAFISSMLVIKDYAESKTGNIFVLYFKYLLDTIKRVYLIEIVLVIVTVLVSFSLLMYWNFLDTEALSGGFLSALLIVSLTVLMLFVVFLALFYINLTFLVAYFRMSLKSYFIISARFSFKYMGQTMISILILLIPSIVLILIGIKFLPIYFLFGISLPQLLMFYINRNRYDNLQRSIEIQNTQKKDEEV